MSERKKPTSFAELVGDVRRLHHDTVEPQPRQSRIPAFKARTAASGDTPQWSDPADAALSDEDGDFQRPGVQHSVMRKLRRRQFTVVDELDLHGLKLAQARAALADFLSAARVSRMICVRIIHGKGLSSPALRAVLKPHVRHWLKQDPRVLAYVPARDRSGGSGAVDVLLRAERE